jgi:hypothetical protein
VLRITTILLLLTFFIACKEEVTYRQESDEVTELKAVVSVPAGEMMPSYDKLSMPPFFNIGTISIDDAFKVPTIILGSRKSKGKKVNVSNLALFSFEKDSSQVNFVISYENDFSDERLDFETFMVEHHDIKEGIESWFKAQCGLGHCRNFGWSSEYKSYLKLNDKKLKN